MGAIRQKKNINQVNTHMWINFNYWLKKEEKKEEEGDPSMCLCLIHNQTLIKPNTFQFPHSMDNLGGKNKKRDLSTWI